MFLVCRKHDLMTSIIRLSKIKANALLTDMLNIIMDYIQCGKRKKTIYIKGQL